MITDAILKLFGNLYKFLIALIPRYDFIKDLANAKTEFINFITPILEHTLYVFNIPVLKTAVFLLMSYITFIIAEYFIKLAIKYITNVV